MIPLLRPTLPKLSSIQSKLRHIFETGMLTNADYVKEFEKECEEFLKVENVIAVSSGTSGLILAMKCLKLKGEVILPSFTFTSSGHSLLWCGLRPIFADIDGKTFNINPDSIEEKITKNTSAILATHVFSNPCDIDRIQEIAEKYNLKVIYDAAHAFGSKYKGESVANFGDAVVFSLTPTKVLTTGEGGLIAVKDKKIAKLLKFGRNNGDSFNRDEEFLGITARMSELNAILGIEGLKILPQALKKRLELVDLYKKELANVPGISFQKIPDSYFSVYRDLTILVDENKFGKSRDQLLKELLNNDIETKVYFYPPLHKKKVYKEFRNILLPNTDLISDKIMNLPLYSYIPEQDVIKICSVIKKI